LDRGQTEPETISGIPMKRIVGNVIAALLGGAITLFILNLIVAGCSKKSPSHALESARETKVGFLEKGD
jgi:hypothetical protein